MMVKGYTIEYRKTEEGHNQTFAVKEDKEILLAGGKLGQEHESLIAELITELEQEKPKNAWMDKDIQTIAHLLLDNMVEMVMEGREILVDETIKDMVVFQCREVSGVEVELDYIDRLDKYTISVGGR